MVNNAGIPANTPLANLFGPAGVPAGAGNSSAGLSAGTNLDGLSGGNIGDGFGDPNAVNPSTFSDRFNASNPNIAGDGNLFGGAATNADLFGGSNPTGTFGPETTFGPSTAGFDPNLSSGNIPNQVASPDQIGNPAGDVVPNAPGGAVPTSTSGGNLPSAPDKASPVAVGLLPNLASDIAGWIANIEKAFGSGLTTALNAGGNAVANYFGGITNWFVRAFLIVLGIVLIAIGLLKLTGGDKVVIQTAKGALAAA
jgi:hypothetical protein